MNIEVSNLSLNVIESDLKKLFTPFGEVASIELLRDKLSNRPRGRAFVEMPVEKDAQNALMSLNGTELVGKTIKLKEVKYQPGADMNSGNSTELPTSLINLGLRPGENTK